MAALQAEHQRIAQALADPGLYQEAPEKVATLNQQRSQTEKAIAAAETAWMAAEEELEAAKV